MQSKEQEVAEGDSQDSAFSKAAVACIVCRLTPAASLPFSHHALLLSVLGHRHCQRFEQRLRINIVHQGWDNLAKTAYWLCLVDADLTG